MAHAALRAAGVRAGRYTSPHLSRPHRSASSSATGRSRPPPSRRSSRMCWPAPIGCEPTGVLPVQPTFFEATTAAAFELFRRAGIEVGVIEVGLGGRFDATNVISPVAGAITTIDFDHQQHLGHTLEAIAFEKAGIIKPGMTIVLGALVREARDVIARVAADRGATLIESAVDTRCTTEMTERPRARDDRDAARRPTARSRWDFVARTRRSNAVVAVRLLESAAGSGVRMPREAIEQGLAEPQWPARLELIQLDDRRQVLLDAAHNPEGARALAAYLQRWHPGTSAARDWRHARQERRRRSRTRCCRHVSTVIATAAPTPRAIPAERSRAPPARPPAPATSPSSPTPARAIDRALEAGADGLRGRVDLPRRRGPRRPQAACYPAVISVRCASSSCAAARAIVCLPGRRPPSPQQADQPAAAVPASDRLSAARSTQSAIAEVRVQGRLLHSDRTGRASARRADDAVRRSGRSLFRDTNRVIAQGNVVFATAGGRLSAERLEYDVATGTGTFHDAPTA